MRKKLLFLLCFLGAVTLSAQYQVGHRSFSFTDPARSNRSVTGEVYYPAQVAGDNQPFVAGAFPLIVFGHGFVMSWSEYSVWWNELAPLGYILVFPRTEGGLFPSHANFAGDFSFLVTKMNAENTNSASPYAGHLSGRNAVIGHSMGGGCAYLSAPLNADIQTLITLAAAETNPSAIAAAANIHIPVLTIAASADCVVTANGGPDDIYNGLSGTAYKAYLNMTGATHCNFGINSTFSACDIGETCTGSISKATQHSLMFLAAESWLAYFLKNDCAAWPVFYNHLTTATTHSYLEAGPLPLATPSITRSGDLLTSVVSGNYTYQWLREDVLIPGANQSTYALQQPGSYRVRITNALGCTAESAPYLVVALPLDWQFFDVQNMDRQRVSLEWGASYLKNVAFFEVQHSRDAAVFSVIGRVNVEPDKWNYAFMDETPAAGDHYYRLKAMDEDGTSALSPIRQVKVASVSSVTLATNPLTVGPLRLLMDIQQPETWQMQIYDSTGKVLQYRTFDLSAGRQWIEWPEASKLAPGTYFLQALGVQGVLQTIPFVKS